MAYYRAGFEGGIGNMIAKGVVKGTASLAFTVLASGCARQVITQTMENGGRPDDGLGFVDGTLYYSYKNVVDVAGFAIGAYQKSKDEALNVVHPDGTVELSYALVQPSPDDPAAG